MVKLPDPPGLVAVIAALGGGETTRLIGGAVRDTLLKLPVSDIDLATRLTPDAVIERLSAARIKVVPTGIAHGTVTAVTQGGPVEITTLRKDIATDGRHAIVAFTDDWREDAARRDFTINALSADPDTGTVHDYFGGIADLEAGHVRFIGSPLQRIAEDHLRILRFFRFHARFGRGDADADALKACSARANDLMALSRERIAAEILKLLDSKAPVPAVRTMVAHGILQPVLPEIKDVAMLDRLVEREARFAIPHDPLRRLAALIGPYPVLAGEIAKRLKFSRVQSRRLIAACGWGDPPGDIAALAYRIGIAETRDRLMLGSGSAAQIEQLDTWTRPRLPLTGGTLIARGLASGPIVAATLSAIENTWIDAGFPVGEHLEAIVANALSQATLSDI